MQSSEGFMSERDVDDLDKQQVCSLCRAVSPVTQTNYTLISSKYQWRMEVISGADGQKEPRWYCPDCWQKLKQIRGASAPSRPSISLEVERPSNRPPPGPGGGNRSR